MRTPACTASRSLAVTAILLLLVCAGCAGGGGDNKPAVVALTAAQATAVATEVNNTFVTSTAGIGSNLCPTIGLKGGQVYLCTVPVARVVPCTGGGIVTVSGSTSGNMDFTNSGATVAALSSLPTSCAVAGTELTITGEPDLAVSGAVDFFYGGVDFVNVTQTGSVNYGPSPAGACPVALTTTASFEGNSSHTVKSCTVVGTACGQTINQSCM